MLGGRSTFFVREHVGMFKLADTFDILDPASNQQIAIAKEEPGTLIHLLRLVVNKRLLPTKVVVYEGSDPKAGKVLFSIKKGVALLRSRVDVLDGNGEVVGWFQSKLLSLGGAFRVFDSGGQEVALVKGDWKGWNFRFLVGDEEIGTVSKKWAGLGKEFFTSADNYVINLTGDLSDSKAVLLLAAGLAVDVVYKEKG
ncbi:MAG: oxidoreductase [Pirellulales bacterium]|nr:oxidoreductase [Pirellulales bacterium]